MATEEKKVSVLDEQVGVAEDVVNVVENEGGAAAAEPEVNTDAPKVESEVAAGAEPSDKTAAETEVVADAPQVMDEVPVGEASSDKTTAETEVKTDAPQDKNEVTAETKPPVKTHAERKPVAVEAVDFAEEDAALAADSPELDMGEETEDESGEPTTEETTKSLEDISRMNKHELVDMFATLLHSKPVQQLRREAEAVKVAFYKLHRAEFDGLKKQFIESGGNPEDFSPATDMEEARLKELFTEYRRRRADYLADLEKTKEENLKIKLAIIEELKELVNSNETMNNTFNTFRELQQRWRDTGVVPQTSVKDLWETYNLHVENFYNYIKINKELRDLDLKRNYEAKLRLCEEAEALILEPSIVTAFRKLQTLHDEWRETGPVANEYKETLWERFKEASSRINRQHQEHFEGIKEEQKRNLELKTELCIKAEELSNEILTTRKEWNSASDRLIEIQKVWKTIGFAPQKDNTRIYERFRRACDRFFELKRSFYEQIKSEMDVNLQQKTEICIMAEGLMDSEDWKKTTDELIALQKRWKEIGPVSRRHSDAIWKRFRAACDHFFERKSAHFAGMDSKHEENLQKKLALLAEMEAADLNIINFDTIKDFQRRWNEIGFVPIRKKDEMQKRYKLVMDAMFATLRGGERERSMDRYRHKVASLKEGGERRLRLERDKLYNRVKQLEADISLLENNIGFFSKSKNAEVMIRDVEEKIEKAKREMAEAIEKINLIDSQE